MNTESHDRRKIQERLESGQTKVVCNIATLTKGIDWKIGCIIIARPTRSKMLHVQIADRKSTRLNSSHSCALRMPSSACKKQSASTHITLSSTSEKPPSDLQSTT